jgi:hypothetical protein
VANELPNTPALLPAPLTDPPRLAPAPSSNDSLASTIAGAVERQITKYLLSMSQQVEAARESAEAARLEMRSDFAQQLDLLTARVDANQLANERYQAALQAALEERLAEFANHQHQTLTKVNAKLAGLPALVQAELPAQFAEISQGLRDYLEHKTSAVETQIDELHKATHRFDDQVGAIVQNINETVTALSRRMDDGDEALSKAVDQRLGDVRGLVDQTGADVARQLAEHGQILSQRVDTIDMKMVDRALAMEERINENNGTKIANLEANIGRVGSAFDEAMGALSKRIVDLEVMVLEAGDRIDGVAADMTKVDEEAINAVKEQLSSAVGEAMLVRIEVDRFMASQDEKFDSTALRMAEIEAQLADSMDVGEAVQLERLEEIERALLELDPNQFVRKVEQSSGGGSPSPSLTPTLPAGGAHTSSEANFASY